LRAVGLFAAAMQAFTHSFIHFIHLIFHGQRGQPGPIDQSAHSKHKHWKMQCVRGPMAYRHGDKSAHGTDVHYHPWMPHCHDGSNDERFIA